MHWWNHITNSRIFICIQNRLNKIKYKTGRHKNGETGSYHYIPPFYVIEIVMVVQFYFAVLSLSLSLSLLSFSTYHMCICFTFCLYHICNNILQPLLSSNIILCLFFTNTHLVWYRFLRQKIDFYRYITFYGYGYNIQHSPLNIFWNFFQASISVYAAATTFQNVIPSIQMQFRSFKYSSSKAPIYHCSQR